VALGDPTAGELTATYNRRRRRAGARACLLDEARAASHELRGQKKRCRPSEVARPAVQAKRRRFLRHIRRSRSTVSSFWTNPACTWRMSRSQTWVKRGTEFIDLCR